MKPPTPAFAYARYSSDNQSDESIETQMSAIMQYAEKNGYQIERSYHDRATSATSTDDRREFLRMFADIEAGADIKAVLVYKLSRYARNSLDALTFERKLTQRKIQLIAVTQDFKTHTDEGNIIPEGVLWRRMQYAFDEYASLNNSAQVTSHMFNLAKTKQPHLGGKPPYGYKLVLSDPDDYKSHRVLQVEPEEAKNVLFIFESVQAGKGYQEIVDELNGRGARTRDKKPFSKLSLNGILKNPRYTGTYVYGQYRYNAITTKIKETNASPVVIENAIPQIVPEGLWNDVNTLMTRRRRRQGGSQKHEYLLSGYLYCGRCGYAMTGESGGERRSPCYRCGNTRGCSRWKVGQLGAEASVVAALWHKYYAGLSAKQILKGLKSEATTFAKTSRSREQKIRTQISECEAGIARLVEAIAGGVALDAITAKLKALEEEKRKAEQQLDGLRRKEAASMPSLQEIKDVLDSQVNAFHGFNVPALRSIINQFITRIEIDQHHIHIDWTDGGTADIGYFQPDHRERLKLKKLLKPPGDGDERIDDQQGIDRQPLGTASEYQGLRGFPLSPFLFLTTSFLWCILFVQLGNIFRANKIHCSSSLHSFLTRMIRMV